MGYSEWSNEGSNLPPGFKDESDSIKCYGGRAAGMRERNRWTAEDKEQAAIALKSITEKFNSGKFVSDYYLKLENLSEIINS